MRMTHVVFAVPLCMTLLFDVFINFDHLLVVADDEHPR